KFEVAQTRIITKLKWMMGRVNSRPFPLLFAAYPWTILFVGYSYTHTYTWRRTTLGGNEIERPPVNLEMKFIEKTVKWRKKIYGHNHFWRPGKGWDLLLIDGKRPTYEWVNFNVLFQ